MTRSTHRAPALLSLSLLFAIFLWLACTTRDGTPVAPTPKANAGHPTIASAIDYAATYDAFAERKNTGDCNSGSCTAGDYNYYPSCQHLTLQRWSGKRCAETSLFFDFDATDLPDDAIITEARLRLYWRESEKSYVPNQPEAPGCHSSDLFDSSANTNVALSTFFKPGGVASAGDSSTAPTKTLPPALCSSTELVARQTGQGFAFHDPSLPKWIDLDIGNSVHLSRISRYAIDREQYSATDSLVAHFFEAIDHSDNHPPTLRVKYKMQFSTCIDGEIKHNNSNCSSCSSSDFTSDANSTTATAHRTSAQSGYCGEQQVATVFSTSGLNDSHTITSATLKFTVQAFSSLDTDTTRVRVYSKKLTGSCPTSIGAGDFIACSSGFTSLGLLTVVGTGTKTFTIPNADTNISKTGLTQFVIIDASTFTSEDGYITTTIYMNEATTSANRPQVEVVYN